MSRWIVTCIPLLAIISPLFAQTKPAVAPAMTEQDRVLAKLSVFPKDDLWNHRHNFSCRLWLFIAFTFLVLDWIGNNRRFVGCWWLLGRVVFIQESSR